jgi:hypothetical protein
MPKLENMKEVLIFNSKINKQPELEIRNSDAGQIVFVPYSKEDRCNRCVLLHYDESCHNTPCSKKERRDKTPGYYRKYRAHVGHEFPVPSTVKLNN